MIVNPYNFVRLGKPGPRDSVRGRGHDHFAGESGRLGCRLTAETHLFVPTYRAASAPGVKSHDHLQFCRDGQTPIIPGTSLKGVFRSVAEAVSGACFMYDALEYERLTVRYNLPRGYNHCDDLDNACPACRTFGLLNHGKVFAGLVAVTDARAVPGTFQTEALTLGILSTPKPHHHAFYAVPGTRDRPRGRKFYYHHAPNQVVTRTKRDDQNKTVDAARPGAVFTFEVEYTNLTEAELALLLLAVGLTPAMRHKIGTGKPVGLGSAHVEIVRWQKLDRRARYRTLHGGWAPVLEGEAATQAAADHVARNGSLIQAGPLEDLVHIWAWPPDPDITIVYPDRQWFQANPNTPLP